MILEPISIATKGYVGVGPSAGAFCPTDIAIATFGYVRIQPPEDLGGGGQLAREERAREEARKRALKNRKELDELFPESLTDSLAELMETGETEIAGTTVEMEPLRVPKNTLQFAIPLEMIEDPIEREIAELIRADVDAQFQRDMAEFRQRQRKMEQQLIVFLILAMED